MTVPPEPDRPVGRRDVLRLAAVGTAAVAVGATSVGTAAPARAATVSPTGTLTRPPSARGLHLLRRATYGPTKASVAEYTTLGTQAWLVKQLAPSTVDDKTCATYLARYPRLSWTIPQVRAAFPDSSTWEIMVELGQATVLRAAWSKRQLFEVMVEFWSNHLNVTNPSSDVWDSRHDYDRTVIRAHALGTYATMLVASATHPAMLRYLNNADSTADNPNENYGRELLELHTVGVDGGYDEDDMRTSALVMTGFGVHENWSNRADPKNGTFEYHPEDHYVGPVSVMGWSHANATPAGGYAVGLAYLNWLARRPATARRIADKLVTRFVSDEPQPALAAHLASVYLANDTAIVPVLKALFAHRTFRDAAHGSKIRRPYEDLVAALRILDVLPDAAGTDGLEALYWTTEGLGQAPLAWHLPDGYPDVATAWQSANGTLSRWNTHLALAGRWWPVSTDPNRPLLRAPDPRTLLPATLPATYGEYVDLLAVRLLFQRLPSTARTGVLAFLGKTEAAPLKATDAAVRWRLPSVVALILDSSYHVRR